MSWCPSVLRPGWAQLMGRGGAGRDGTHVARTTTASCAPSPTGSDSSQSRSLPIAAIRRIAPGWLARARARALPLRWSRRAAVVCQAGRAEAGQGQPSRAVQAQQSAPAVPGAWPGRIYLPASRCVCVRTEKLLSFQDTCARMEIGGAVLLRLVGWLPEEGGTRPAGPAMSVVRSSEMRHFIF
jgi:hypothetical protein